MAKRSTHTRDGIYQRKDRPGFWISWSDSQGRRRYRKTNAQNITQARGIRSAELLRVEHARVLGFTPPGEETFAEVANRFDAHQKARLTVSAYEREHSILENHLKPFFPCKLAAIRRVDVQRYVSARTVKVSAHSVQKELNVLKHLLRLAVEWEIIPLQPAQGVKSPKVGAGRVRYLQPAELRLLVESSPEWLRQIVVFAVSTGMRRSELLGLRWLDVDLMHDRVLLPQTKNGDGRIVYLNHSARSALQSVPVSNETKSTDKVFAAVTPDQVSVTFRRLCKKNRILDFRFHDLRHTAASWMRMQGADIHTVAQLLGHKDLRMAARYQHLSPAFLSEAVGRLDAVFGEFRYQALPHQRRYAKRRP
jgi:site-specific recombinase XerD